MASFVGTQHTPCPRAGGAGDAALAGARPAHHAIAVDTAGVYPGDGE